MRGQKQANANDDQGSADDFIIDFPQIFTLILALAQGQWNRHPNHKKKEWKNPVGRRTAMPICVQQRPINIAPIPGVVDQNHTCNGESTHHIEGKKAARSLHLLKG